MKINDIPLGGRFVLEGQTYVKTGPMMARGEGGETRVVPRYMVLQAAAGEAPPAWKRLTEREWHVLRLIVKGVSLTGIGEELCLSVKTVSTYRGRVLAKLGLHSNAELVRYCLEHGLAE